MAEELWLPNSARYGQKDIVEVERVAKRHLPNVAKEGGGSYFDDELETEESVQQRVERQMIDLIAHLNARPDHNVYVSSPEDRAKMRAAFNVWKRRGLIGHNPTIKIEYGVPEGGIRVAE